MTFVDAILRLEKHFPSFVSEKGWEEKKQSLKI
jgi:hypothetical protein